MNSNKEEYMELIEKIVNEYKDRHMLGSSGKDIENIEHIFTYILHYKYNVPISDLVELFYIRKNAIRYHMDKLNNIFETGKEGRSDIGTYDKIHFVITYLEGRLCI